MYKRQEFRRIKPKKKKTQKANKKQKVAHGDTPSGNAHVEDEEDEEDDSAPPPVQEQKRTLGLIILRGETIISISVEAPPSESKRDVPVMAPGPGRGVPAGRGAAMGAVPMGRPPPFGPPPGFAGPPPMGPPPGFGGPPPMGPPPGFRPPGMP